MADMGSRSWNLHQGCSNGDGREARDPSWLLRLRASDHPAKVKNLFVDFLHLWRPVHVMWSTSSGNL